MENIATLLVELLLLAAIGGFVGVLGGMLGIGGGVMIVPLLDAMFQWHGVSKEYALHMAVATSLGTIIFTNLRTARVHALNQNIHLPFILRWAPSLLLGCALAALFALRMEESTIAWIFCLALLPLFVNLLYYTAPIQEMQLISRVPFYILQPLGVVVGFVATVAGLGGAILAGPLMLRFGFTPRQTAGNASAIGLLVAVPASLATMMAGLSQPYLPDYTIGYLYWPALLIIGICSMATVPYGVALSQKINARTTRLIFAGLLFIAMLKIGGPYALAFLYRVVGL